MANKKKKQKKNPVLPVIFSIIGIVCIPIIIYGALSIFNRGVIYDEEIIACDDKDYSSYIKKKEYETPGNENINNQIEIYKQAIQEAANDDDYYSMGKLIEDYNKLLALQSQTKTTDTVYDYSGVSKAKGKCYSLATKHKETALIIGIVCLVLGCVLLATDVVAARFVLFKAKKH